MTSNTSAATYSGAVGHAYNVGLKTVQQEYRYLHDVEARHGIGAALLEGVGIVAGGVAGGIAGTFAGGNTFEGAVLGSEGYARIEGAMVYKDARARAANPNYKDPHTGQLVSFGRDLTSWLGVGGGAGKVTLGRPRRPGGPHRRPGVAIAGKAVGAERMLNITADNVERPGPTRSRGSARPPQTSQSQDAGTIARRYPQFQDIAQTLAAAKTPVEVKDVFRDYASANEMLDATKYPDAVVPRDDEGNVTQAAGQAAGVQRRHRSRSLLATRKLLACHPRGGAANSGGGDGWFSDHLANNVLVGPARWARRLDKLPGTTYDRCHQLHPGHPDQPGQHQRPQRLHVRPCATP